MEPEILPSKYDTVHNFTVGIKYAGLGVLLYCAGTGIGNLVSGIGDAFRYGTINKVSIEIDQSTVFLHKDRMDVLKVALQDMSPIERKIVALELAKFPNSIANSYVTTH